MQNEKIQKGQKKQPKLATIGRSEIADAVCRVKAALSHKEARQLVDQVLEEITVGLERDGSTSVYGFGVFAINNKAQRIGRNPITGDVHIVTARKVVQFKASKSLRRAVQSVDIRNCETVVGHPSYVTQGLSVDAPSSPK